MEPCRRHFETATHTPPLRYWRGPNAGAVAPPRHQCALGRWNLLRPQRRQVNLIPTSCSSAVRAVHPTRSRRTAGSAASSSVDLHPSATPLTPAGVNGLRRTDVNLYLVRRVDARVQVVERLTEGVEVDCAIVALRTAAALPMRYVTPEVVQAERYLLRTHSVRVFGAVTGFRADHPPFFTWTASKASSTQRA
jgi:hypothetical protein